MSRRLLIKLFATGGFLLAGFFVSAQYYFEKLTIENGLSDNRVTSFYKDSKGYMWIGTANGLNRYDGHSFRIYRPGQTRFNLSGEYITSIAEDKQGRMWVATRSGLNVLNVAKDSLRIFSPDDDLYPNRAEGLLSILLWDIKIDASGRVWIAPDHRDLCYYDPAKNKFIYQPWVKFAESLFPHIKDRYCSINKLYFRGDTALWLGTTLGLFSYNIAKNEFHYYGGEHPFDFIALREDVHAKKVFFSQESGGIQVIDLQQNSYQKLDNNKLNRPNIPATQQGTWLPANDKIWEIINAEAYVIEPNSQIPFSSSHAQVKAVYTDNHNITWIGSSKGVTRYDPRLNRFSFKSVFPVADSISGNVINNIYYSETDSTYFGVSHRYQQVFSWTEKDGYKPLKKINYFDPFINFSNFYTDSKKNLWLLTTGGIYRYDRKSKKFIFISNPSKKEDVIYTAMMEDDKGDLWAGSYPDGIFHFNTKTAAWTSIQPSHEFESRIITSIQFDKKSRLLWVGSYDYGLHSLDLNTGIWKSFGMEANNPRRMHSSLITDVALDAVGNTWVATHSGGLSKLDASGKSQDCINYKIESGLPDNNINALVADTKGNTWFSLYRGLTCIDKNGRIVKQFENRNGLPYENYISRLQITSDGCLITAVRNGFVRFHPDSVIYTTDPYPVVITACRVKDSSLRHLDSFITARNRFSYKMNEWQFEFTALNYTTPSNIQYFYKLDGYDDQWVDAGNAHTAKYTNLDNGHYKFRVKALHPSGMYSANEAIFSFSISPPFWKTWWFLLLSIAIVAAIVYFVYRYQLNKKLEVERLRLRISRDLHDDIGSALTSINVLSKVALSKGGANMEIGNYLSQIKNAASDTMESMSDIVWAINPQNDKLEAMISRMKEFAAEICEAKQVDLDFILPDELEKISFDAGKRKNIFLIFKESVNNAIKYSNCTRLYVGFTKEGSQLSMQINDNGTGFDPLNCRTGNGLRNMKERAALIGGNVTISSQKGKGTSVQTKIPVS